MPTVLFFLIVAILALAGILLFIVLKKKPARVYKPKGQFLLSKGEAAFFDALTRSIPPYLYICPKVRIADIIETHLARDDPHFWNYQSKINQKHTDFLLVNRADTTPLLALELDGSSHYDKERAKRDSFIDSVFASAGIPILHIPVRGFYQYSDLRHLIETTITNTPNFSKNVL